MSNIIFVYVHAPLISLTHLQAHWGWSVQTRGDGTPNQHAHRLSVISRVFSRTPIACPHLASGTESNSLSKKDEVNTGSLPWVNGTKNEGQDFYYGPAPYQTQNSHLSVTWLTCYPSEQVFNYEWHVWTKEHYIFEVQLCSHFFFIFFFRGGGGK